ncbi:MAG: class I SAM-dependent methyltransferase [Acetobacterium sp.]|nr:class I SAM-dependent methyltransferase [Acetobacterium sp.]
MNFYTEFGKVKEKYAKYRPTYPDSLFTEIMSNLKSPYKNAIDLGAGTGLSTAFLRDNFQKVYAIEPDKSMVNELQKINKNVEIFSCAAEELEMIEADIDLITSGNAFYWMDGEVIISKIYKWLKPNGIFAVYKYNIPTTISAAEKIISEEDKKWDEFRHERLKDKEYSIRTIKNSNLFSDVKVKVIDNTINLTGEEIVGFFSSTSYGSAYIRTIDNPDKYIDRLIDKIKNITNERPIPVNFNLELIITKK